MQHVIGVRPWGSPGPADCRFRRIAVQPDGRAWMQGAADQRIVDLLHRLARQEMRVRSAIGDVVQS